MDLETIKIMGYIVLGGIVIIAISRFTTKPKECSVCGSVATDEYLSTDGFVSLCRQDLIQRWKKDFLASPYLIILIEPEFNRNPFGYVYGTVDDLKEWSYPKEDTDNMSAIMDTVPGKNCTECGEVATVAYFKKEDFKAPFFSKIKASPSYLCKVCTVKKIEPVLETAGGKSFAAEGLWAPLKDKGIYHIQQM